jgi:hypothetical protein
MSYFHFTFSWIHMLWGIPSQWQFFISRDFGSTSPSAWCGASLGVIKCPWKRTDSLLCLIVSKIAVLSIKKMYNGSLLLHRINQSMLSKAKLFYINCCWHNLLMDTPTSSYDHVTNLWVRSSTNKLWACLNGILMQFFLLFPRQITRSQRPSFTMKYTPCPKD